MENNICSVYDNFSLLCFCELTVCISPLTLGISLEDTNFNLMPGDYQSRNSPSLYNISCNLSKGRANRPAMPAHKSSLMQLAKK